MPRPDREELLRQFDQFAMQQLCEEVQKLSKIVETLQAEKDQWEQRYHDSEEWADSLRDEFMDLQLSTLPDHKLGITQCGRLVAVDTQ